MGFLAEQTAKFGTPFEDSEVQARIPPSVTFVFLVWHYHIDDKCLMLVACPEDGFLVEINPFPP